jgi:methylated-DNA-[protein]-cysteine S-methyltransferase
VEPQRRIDVIASTWHSHFATPLGVMRATTDGRSILALAFDAPGVDAMAAVPEAPRTLLDSLRQQLDEYFAGRRTAFELPLAPAGTPFQRDVWRALCTVPYGQTASYAHIALQVGSPAAVRAVGAANGRNPIAIVIPCHRIIGSNGTLTGYAGGLDRKRRLLALEAPVPFSRQAA